MCRIWKTICAVVTLVILVQGSSAFAASFSVKRAINIAQWLTWPRYDAANGIEWPPFARTPAPPTVAELTKLREVGFDTVRLPVDPAPLFLFEGDRRAAVYALLFDAIARIETAGMNVIVDIHPNSRHPVWGQDAVAAGQTSPAFQKVVQVVEELARRLEGRTRSVALELLNEPRLKCEGADQKLWQDLLRELVSRARSANPGLTLVVTGACVSAPEGLLALDPGPIADANILYTFHFYEPFSFTHQGAQFIPWPDKYLDGVPWPFSARAMEDVTALVESQVQRKAELNAAERLIALTRAKHNLRKFYASKADAEMIRRRFGQIADWARSYGIAGEQVFLGEFGVVRREAGKPGAFCEDRARWHRDVVAAAEAYGFAWAYFSYDGPFGLINESSRQLDPVTLASLGLRSSCSAKARADTGEIDPLARANQPCPEHCQSDNP
jgi:hypothetical protein